LKTSQTFLLLLVGLLYGCGDRGSQPGTDTPKKNTIEIVCTENWNSISPNEPFSPTVIRIDEGAKKVFVRKVDGEMREISSVIFPDSITTNEGVFIMQINRSTGAFLELHRGEKSRTGFCAPRQPPKF
jgi:hypothetical protein